jgi:type IV pilus assembly protein PilM
MKLFNSSAASFVGIDLGSSGIKVVELKKDNGLVKLVNYGFNEVSDLNYADWQRNTSETAEIINSVCGEAGILSKNAISALPTFSVFSSVLNLTNVAKKDIASAVHWEAKKVIPLPLEEMILDWKKIEEEKTGNGIKVLLTGAPRALVKRYIDIFKKAQLNLLSLETETFSLVRSLLGNDKSTIMLVEMGASTTDVSIVDRAIPMLNRSIDIGGLAITKAISSHLNIGLEKAEQFKYDLGVGALSGAAGDISQLIIENFSPIANEIKYAINLYQAKNGKKTEKIILSGGSALLPNISKYLSDILNMNVIIGNPWARISYPPDLEPLLNEIGPRFSVAIGLAMRETE